MTALSLFKRGNKRRVAAIRWTRRQLIQALLLAIVLIAFCLWVGMWVATHHFD